MAAAAQITSRKRVKMPEMPRFFGISRARGAKTPEKPDLRALDERKLAGEDSRAVAIARCAVCDGVPTAGALRNPQNCPRRRSAVNLGWARR